MASQIISKRLISGFRPSGCCVRPLFTSQVAGNRLSQLVKAVAAESPPITDVITDDPSNNVTENIFNKIGVNLHRKPAHPLNNIKDAIYEYFDTNHTHSFNKFDDLYPIVSTEANFDSVLVPPDHVSRSPNDTYYVAADSVLRCHTSAHQAELLCKGEKSFLVTGDVYRRDSVDRTHYPVFHQMEGFRIFTPEEVEASGMSAPSQSLTRTGEVLAVKELKESLEGLAKHLFGDVECRWVDAYFPFTSPSFELEIFFEGDWLEVLGCGITEQSILDANGNEGNRSWAFGLGLERLAMVLYNIPDIRLFWSGDKRFLDQFTEGDIRTKFKAFSKYPPVFKDIAFWITPDFTENNLAEICRGAGGDLVEEVKLIDEFENPKKGKTSNCFRITYRSMERSLTDEEINAIQEQVRNDVQAKLGVELR